MTDNELNHIFEHDNECASIQRVPVLSVDFSSPLYRLPCNCTRDERLRSSIEKSYIIIHDLADLDDRWMDVNDLEELVERARCLVGDPKKENKNVD